MVDPPRIYWEAWALQEALLRLGFRPEEVFALYSEDQALLRLVVKAQGRDFVADVGKLVTTQAEFEQTWVGFMTNVRDRKIPERKLRRKWERSTAKREAAGLAVALVQKGFRLGASREN